MWLCIIDTQARLSLSKPSAYVSKRPKKLHFNISPFQKRTKTRNHVLCKLPQACSRSGSAARTTGSAA